MACYKMKDKLYPDTSVSENAQKRIFRRIPDSSERKEISTRARRVDPDPDPDLDSIGSGSGSVNFRYDEL